MCTVTFIARRRGFLLGMNRDEQRSRTPGLPPKKVVVSGVQVLCPSEPGGGTWIAVNEKGNGFALINWYAIKVPQPENPLSRGEVVKAVSPTASPEGAAETILALPLSRVRPFRLMGFFPGERKVVEWRWNGLSLITVPHPWKTNLWISSGHDEPGAQVSRGRVFQQALRQTSAGTAAWLRRLHRSHRPELGPYSICMHRADAATVSYTEITSRPAGVKMSYHGMAPCQALRAEVRILSRQSPEK